MNPITRVASILFAVLVIGAMVGDASAGAMLGGGLHYLRSLDEIDDADGFDENSIGFLGSLRLGAAGLKADAMLEYIPDYLGFDEALIMPQAYLLLGQFVYGGVGIGMGYYDGDWTDDPFYALRAGVNLELGGLNVDGFATYRFHKWKTLEDADSETWNSITFGAVVRFAVGPL